MGRTPCCDKANVKKGPWSPEEDSKLKGYIEKYGTGGNWIALPRKAGLRRCGKSCRLRWLNYLRPNIKHGEFSDEEDRIILTLFATIGSRWSIIATQLPGRTDNDIKNYWNTKLKKKLMSTMIPNPKKIIKSSLSSQTFLPPNIYHQSSPLSLLSQPLSSSLLYGDNLFYPSSTNRTSTIHDPIANSSLFTGGLNVSSSVIPPISLLPDNNCIVNPSSMLLTDEGNPENPVELPYSCRQTIIKQERTDHLQGFISDGSEESHHQTRWEEKRNDGYYGEGNYDIGSAAVDFDLEEMRRLIGSSSGGSGNSSFLSSLY